MSTFFIILTSAIIFPITIIGCLKVLQEGGINFPERRFFHFLLPDTVECEDSKEESIKNSTAQKRFFSLKSATKIFMLAILFRIVTYFISFIILRTIIYAQGEFDLSIILRDWVRWDANNYIRIATLGYDGYYENGMATTLVFFPLYSWIMKFFHIFISSIAACGLIVSSLCYGLGCVFLYALVSIDYGKSVGKRAVILISVFPFSFFFGAIMPESVFFFTGCACMYFTRRRRFVISGIFGALASLSRMQGLLLTVFFVTEWVNAYKPFALIRKKDFSNLFKSIFTKLTPVLIMPVGTLIYLYQNYKVTGDAFKFLEYQETVWGQHAQYFGVTVADNFNNILNEFLAGSSTMCIWLPQFVLFFLCCATLIYGIRSHKSGYILFLVLYLVMNYTPSLLLSGGRYMTVAFPMFIILADFFEKHPKMWDGVIIVSGILFGVYMGVYLNYGRVF